MTRFAPCRRPLVGVAALGGAVSGAGHASAEPAFRAAVDIVSLNVTVTDGVNRYVTDLERG